MKFTQEEIKKQCTVAFTGISYYGGTASIRGTIEREIVTPRSKIEVDAHFSVLVENGKVFTNIDHIYACERFGVNWQMIMRCNRFKNKDTLCAVIRANLNKNVIKTLISQENKRFKQRYKLLQKEQAALSSVARGLLKTFGVK